MRAPVCAWLLLAMSCGAQDEPEWLIVPGERVGRFVFGETTRAEVDAVASR